MGVHGLKRILVADLDSLFLMKAVTLNSRIATRDLFDVYTLVHAHGYRETDIFSYARNSTSAPIRSKPGCATPDTVSTTRESRLPTV